MIFVIYMNRYLLLFITILFVSCSSTQKVDLRKINLTDTNITFQNWTFNDFSTAFKSLHPKEAHSLATTETQKTAAQALEYIIQNKYENAAKTFVNAMRENDSLEELWKYFPLLYYSMNVNRNLVKLEECYETIRNSATDNPFAFYRNKPQFDMEFVEDSVVISIELKYGYPLIKIEINGKYYYFVFDTGCSRTLIGKNIATENNVVCDNKKLIASTVDGSVNVFSSIFPDFNLGSIKISNFPTVTIDRDYAINAKFLFISLFRVDGIIGWDLLQNFDFTIDYKNKQLVLRKPIEKNTEQRNLFWYYMPIVKFYYNGYPLLFVLDTGSNLTSFNELSISSILGIDTNNLEKRTRKIYGMNGMIKSHEYKYPDFQCYTIVDNEVTLLSVNIALLQNMEGYNIPINVDGVLGSDWFKDKAVRFDITNGIFQISE